MSEKTDHLKEFFQSLKKLEGFDESDMQEMEGYLGVDEELLESSAKSEDSSFELISEFMNSLKSLGHLSAEDLNEIMNYSQDPSEKVPEVLIKETEEEPSKDIRVLLSKMKLPQKVKMGMFGNAACRAILITNGNRLIQMSVLKNPKLQEKEILEFAKNTNMSKTVLRAIAENRQWMASYGIKMILVSNPKTPLDVSSALLRFINPPDLKKLSRSKNIPGPLVTQAKKRLEVAEKKS